MAAMGRRINLGFECECACGCGTQIIRDYRASGVQQFVGDHGLRYVTQIVESIKASNPCEDCGKTFSSECMDFDHRPGEGKFRPVSLIKNEEDALEEIGKCDLVCACCHRTRTKMRLYS